jgi:hypothetical protein
MDLGELFRVSSEAYLLKVIDEEIAPRHSRHLESWYCTAGATAINRGFWTVVERLVKLNVQLDPFVLAAVVSDKVEALELVLAHNPAFRLPYKNRRSINDSPAVELSLAAEHGSTRVLCWLIAQGYACPPDLRNYLLRKTVAGNHLSTFNVLYDAIISGGFGLPLVGYERLQMLVGCAECAGENGCPEIFALCTAEPGVMRGLQRCADIMFSGLAYVAPFEPGRAADIIATADAILPLVRTLHQDQAPAAATVAARNYGGDSGDSEPESNVVPLPDYVFRARWVSHLASAVRSSNAALVRWMIQRFRARTSARVVAQLAAAGLAAVMFCVRGRHSLQCTPYPAGSVGAHAVAEIVDMLIEAVADTPGLTFAGLTVPDTRDDGPRGDAERDVSAGTHASVRAGAHTGAHAGATADAVVDTVRGANADACPCRVRLDINEFSARFLAALRDFGGQKVILDIGLSFILPGLCPSLHRLALLLLLRLDVTLSPEWHAQFRATELDAVVLRSVPAAPASAEPLTGVALMEAVSDIAVARRASHALALQQAPGGVTLAPTPLPALAALFPARAAPLGPEEPCPVCYCIGAEAAACAPHCVHLRRYEDVEDARICQWLLSDPAARAIAVKETPLSLLARDPAFYRKPNTLAVLLSAGLSPAGLADTMLGCILSHHVTSRDSRDVAVFSVLRAFLPAGSRNALGPVLLQHAKRGSLLAHIAQTAKVDLARFLFSEPAGASRPWFEGGYSHTWLTAGDTGCSSALGDLASWAEPGWARHFHPSPHRAAEYAAMLVALARAELADRPDADARARLWSLLNEVMPPASHWARLRSLPSGKVTLPLVACATRIACRLADTWPALEVLLRAGGSPACTSLRGEGGGGTILHELLAPLAPVRTTNGSVGAPLRAVLQAVRDSASIRDEAAAQNARNSRCAIM